MSIKVVFAGSADFGSLALEALVKSNDFEVQFVLSNPAKPFGRKQELQLPPLALSAEKLGLKVKTPANKQELINLIEAIEEFERPDFLVVIAYGMLIPEKVLRWPKVAPINVHGSVLPKYRGASPIQSALLNDDWEHIGNSIMQMTEGLDEGPVYTIEKYKAKGTETAGEIFQKLSEQASEILPATLKEIYSGALIAKPQIGQPTLCTKIRKEDGMIDLKEITVDWLLAKYRAYTPWPGIFYFDENSRRVILREIKKSDLNLNSRPGELICVEGAVYLGVKDGLIELIKVQSEGKSILAAEDWFLGKSKG